MANGNPSPGNMSVEALQALQDGISASIKTILATYDACTDPTESATLLAQSQQLSAQMSQIETILFHKQATEATDTIKAGFAAANGYIAELKDMAGDLEKVSDIISSSAKLISVLTQIIPYLGAL
jgi:hypothetical protein